MKKEVSRSYSCVIVVAFVVLTLILSPSVWAGKIQLPKDKEVKIGFEPNAKISSGDLKAGDSVNIALAEAIDIGGVPVVEKGATGKAVVKDAKKAGWLHKRGYIKLEFVYLNGKGDFQLPSGSKIMLSGAPLEKKGSKRLFPAIPILPLFILPAGQGTINSNAVYPATIKESIILESK